MPHQVLRKIVYRLIDEATRCNDIDRKQALAYKACELAQEAELAELALTEGDELWRFRMRAGNIARYRRLLAKGITDETERQLFETLLRDTRSTLDRPFVAG